MPDLPTIGWLFAIAGGAAILGVAIAYGLMRNRERTTHEKLQSEAGARRIYEEEDRQA